MEAGFTALYQKCVHLGCRAEVPECKTSQWFECPCHGSQYNRNGEKKGGPAPRPRPLPAHGVRRQREHRHRHHHPGPPIGTNTTGQEAEGPHCVGGGEALIPMPAHPCCAASTVKAVGVVIAFITTIGFITYAVVNVRAGRAEVASEIELAANRKPYYDDEALEGPKLEQRSSASGSSLLVVIAVRPPALLAGRARSAERSHRDLRPDLREPRCPPLRAHRRRRH